MELITPGAHPTRASQMSLTPDQHGQAVVTWGDLRNTQDQYYALIDSAANVVTPPMIFATTPYGLYNTDGSGQAAASYSGPVSSEGDASIVSSAPWVGATPGGIAVVYLTVENLGTRPLAGGTLTATFNPALTYLNDDVAWPVSGSGNSVSWSIPTLSFLDGQPIRVWVNLAGNATIGSSYPISLSLTGFGSESNSGNNNATMDVMAARLITLPALQR